MIEVKKEKIDEILEKAEKKDSPTSWSTEQEVKFIKRLGLHSKSRHKKPTKLEYLLLYLDTISRRVHWGTIDKMVILDVIESEIDAMQGKG